MFGSAFYNNNNLQFAFRISFVGGMCKMRPKYYTKPNENQIMYKSLFFFQFRDYFCMCLHIHSDENFKSVAIRNVSCIS